MRQGIGGLYALSGVEDEHLLEQVDGWVELDTGMGGLLAGEDVPSGPAFLNLSINGFLSRLGRD